MPQKLPNTEIKSYVSGELHKVQEAGFAPIVRVLREALFSAGSNIDWDATRNKFADEFPEVGFRKV